jgi:transmembrane sensor
MEELDIIFEIARLIAKEKTDRLSDSENRLLQNWLGKSDINNETYKKLQDGKKLINELNELEKFDEQKAFKKVEQIIHTKRKQLKPSGFLPAFWKYAAAVAILIASSYIIITKTNKHEISHYTQNTILPGKQKAILITSDNQIIELNSSSEVQIIKDRSADIILSDSTLSYYTDKPVVDSKNAMEYNTLITPRGGVFTVVLSDSTSVILNSGSKLKYPVVFNDSGRDVELEGEAFFQVKKSRKTPFIVKTNDINVTVYGTVFNVSAYTEENYIQTTLVEGKVGVSLNNILPGSEIELSPGQQLTYDKGTGSTQTTDVNTRQLIAWTEGKFVFENEPVESILSDMSRWYNFNFEFKDGGLKKQRFTLNLSRNSDIKNILEMISISSDLKFLIKGDSIIVYSENE